MVINEEISQAFEQLRTQNILTLNPPFPGSSVSRSKTGMALTETAGLMAHTHTVTHCAPSPTPAPSTVTVKVVTSTECTKRRNA